MNISDKLFYCDKYRTLRNDIPIEKFYKMNKVSFFLLTLLFLASYYVPSAKAQDTSFSIPMNDPVPAPLPLFSQTTTAETNIIGDAIEKLLATSYEFSAARYDLETIISHLEADPYMAFDFVRDQIAFDPYQGILRGSDGAIGAQAANSWGQSLLLRDLLNAIGIQTRLMQGSLSSEKQDMLRSQIATNNPQADLRQTLTGINDGYAERLKARAHRDYEGLINAFQPLFNQAEIITPNISSHIWVQAKIDGNWIDLDPSFHNAKAGDIYAQDAIILEKIPDDAYHTITLDIIAETLSEDALTEKKLLHKTFKAIELQNTPIYLYFTQEQNALGGGLFGRSKGGEALIPVLNVEAQTTKGDSFSLQTSDAAPSLFNEESQAQDFFFGESNITSTLTGMYMDVTTQSPNGEERTERKIMLDRLTSDQRMQDVITHDQIKTSKDSDDELLQGLHQIAVSTGATNPYQVAQGMAFALYDIAQFHNASEDQKQERNMEEALWPFWALNQKIVLATENWVNLVQNDQYKTDYYIDRPRIYVFTRFATGTGDSEMSFRQIDWLSDGINARSITPQNPEMFLWYGALQSALETTIMESSEHILATDDSILKSTSILSPPPLKPVKNIGATYPAGLLKDLKNGYAIASSDKSMQAWWRYNPKTAHVKAMLMPALGGTMHGRRPGYANTTGGFNDKAWHVDPRTGNSLDPDDMARARKRAAAKRPKPPRGLGRCKPGTEYSMLLTCVSAAITIAVGYYISQMEEDAVIEATKAIKELPTAPTP